MTDGRTEAAGGAIMDSRYGWNREFSILEAGRWESARRDAKAGLAAADAWDREHGWLRVRNDHIALNSALNRLAAAGVQPEGS